MIVELAITRSNILHIPLSPYLPYCTLTVSVLFLIHWLLGLLTSEKENQQLWRLSLLHIAAATALFISFFSFAYFWDQAEYELHPGERFPLLGPILATGLISLIQAATAVILIIRERRIRHPGIRLFSPFLVLVLLVSSGSGSVTGLFTAPPYQWTMTGTTAPGPSIPVDVSEVSWNLDLPEDSDDAYAVEPTASGVLINLTYGTMALDAGTGQEIWRFRWPGTNGEEKVSSDGKSVLSMVNTYDEPGGVEDTTELVTLDASTGDIIDMVSYPYGNPHPEGLFTDHLGTQWKNVGDGIVARRGEGQILSGFSSASGEPLWEFKGSSECVPDTSRGEEGLSHYVTSQNKVIASVYCLDAQGEVPERGNPIVHALNASTGEVEWVHTIPIEGETVDAHMTLSPDRSLIYRQERSSERYFVIDTETGQEINSGDLDGLLVEEPIVGEPGTNFLMREENTDTYALVDGTGEVLSTVNVDAEFEHSVKATGEALYAVEWERGVQAPATLTVHPWDGSEPVTIDDVFGRNLNGEENAGVQPAPGGIVVYAAQDVFFTAVVGIR